MKKLALCIFLTFAASTLADQYKDGMYSAQSSKAHNGWTSVVQVQIEKGVIKQIQIEDFNKNNEKRSANIAENETLKTKTGMTYSELVNKFTTQVMAKNDVVDIDEVAGATRLSEIFEDLTEAALDNAEKGNTTRVTVK